LEDNGSVPLPRLALATHDPREIARVIRGALRLRVEVVSLVAPPSGPGQHMLDVDVPGVGTVTLLAEPAGPARSNGVPLSVRPVTRVQMAQLFSLVEDLDEPSRTEPPPPAAEDYAFAHEDGGADDTMIDAESGSTTPSRGWIPSRIPPGSGIARSPFAAPAPAPAPVVVTPAAGDAPPPLRGRPDSRVGRVVAGKYFVEGPIGSGAAATVYRAVHKDLRRPVAVKILHAEHQREEQFIRRFKAEGLTASKLEHVNVTRVIDFGEEHGELYLVMELVNGRSIEAILESEGPFTQRRVADIGIQVCRALIFAHGRGVIHRDIKPENVMLVPDVDDFGEPCDLVKVCDFGLAKLRDSGDEITLSGMLCGSPAYMSPEQTRGDALDARSDIYALGVTLFEALSGALPHEAHDIAELFVKKCTAPPRRPSDLVGAMNPTLDDIVTRAMAIDPNDRQTSARDLLTELRAVHAALED
jgi:serine/threonine-protein kinase